jgi:acetyl esterase
VRPQLQDAEVAELLSSMDDAFPRVHLMDGPGARAAIAARARPAPPDVPGVEATNLQVPTRGGLRTVRCYSPVGPPPGFRPALVFLHGGGFVFCDLDTHDAFCRRACAGTGAVVLSVDYRLAPEHRAPAAAEDGLDVLRWTHERAAQLGVDPQRIAVAGDSAGGNLAAVVCLLARADGGPAPAAQVLLYPVIDPSCSTPSHARYGTGCVNTTVAMRWYWQQYLGPDVPSPSWTAAPLLAPDHAALPPAVVVTAGVDPLTDEGRDYAAALRRSGVRVLHRAYPGLFHGFLTLDTFQPAVSARELLWQDLVDLLGPRSGSGVPA